MQITRSDVAETAPGPGDWFTGTVYIDTLAAPSGSSRLGAASVHFAPTEALDAQLTAAEERHAKQRRGVGRTGWRASFATALAQVSVAAIALVFGLGSTGSPPVRLLALDGFFVVLFAGPALLFRYAGRERPPAGAGQEG